MWQPAGRLVDKHWNVRPNGRAWLDLVKKQWWTDTTATTDATGTARARVFKGDYELDLGTAKSQTSVNDATTVILKS